LVVNSKQYMGKGAIREIIFDISFHFLNIDCQGYHLMNSNPWNGFRRIIHI